MSDTNPPRLLIKMPPEVGQRLQSQPLRLDGNTFRLRPLCPNEATGRQPGAAPQPRWYVAEANPASATAAELWELRPRGHRHPGRPHRGPGGLYGAGPAPSWQYEPGFRIARNGAGPAPYDPRGRGGGARGGDDPVGEFPEFRGRCRGGVGLGDVPAGLRSGPRLPAGCFVRAQGPKPESITVQSEGLALQALPNLGRHLNQQPWRICIRHEASRVFCLWRSHQVLR